MAIFKRVVISGATGAIGMALISKLIQENIKVLVLYRKESLRISQIQDHPLIKKVVCSLNEMSNFQLTSNEKYDVFYHFAWDGTSGMARDDMYLQNKNIEYTLDAVHLAKRLGCNTFIGAGSQAEYGRVESRLTPDMRCLPENGYGIAKLCAGQMSRILCEKLGIRHIWTRILSVYGPWDNKNSLISSTIIKLINKEEVHFTKGEQIWDFLYSDDAANAFYLLAKKGVNGKVYCLGSGKKCLLKDAIIEIFNQLNITDRTGIGDLQYSDKQVMFLWADIKELVEDVGFVPNVSLKDGIQKTINYYKQWD